MLKKIKEIAQVVSHVATGKSMVETLVPQKRNKVEVTVIRADGTVSKHLGYNTRVASGALWQADVMGSAAGTPANYIALSSNVLTTANGDTTLSGEISSGTNAGLARALGTFQNYTAPTVSGGGGAASYQITKTFTSTASSTVNSAGMFNASSGGSLFVEANLSPAATLANGDQLVLTWSINI
jgi:hypothetical protein